MKKVFKKVKERNIFLTLFFQQEQDYLRGKY